MDKTDAPRCFSCGKELALPAGPVGRRESCTHCGSDVRACRNCAHYDPRAYNECREVQAERVVEKERANFCDYFVLGGASGDAQSSKSDVLKKLDDLFK